MKLLILILSLTFTLVATAGLRSEEDIPQTAEEKDKVAKTFEDDKLKCKYILDKNKAPMFEGKINCNGVVYIQYHKFEELEEKLENVKSDNSNLDQSPRRSVKKVIERINSKNSPNTKNSKSQ